MKRILLSLLTLNSTLFTLSAAVPLKWTVETSRATPAQFEAYQGETLALEAALKSYGKPLEAPSEYALYWQTNGMGNAWWSTNCNHTIEQSEQSNNVLLATWTPSMETGALVYNCFIGKPGTIYHAAFQLRLRPSPGATPNALPLPQPVIDFAKVTVLNPPWSGGGGGVDGAARPLPKYLHALDFCDSYPDDAAWYYDQPQDYGGCSAMRDGGFLYRNYDWKFDDRAEFVVRVSSRGGDIPVAERRFASVGVANCGTNLTEEIVTSGKWSRYYKCLPGRVVDGINENGVVAEVNVVDGDPHDYWPTSGDIHPLAAVRWALDNGTSAYMVASNLAARIAFPSGWEQNFHWMIADAEQTWIVENGTASNVTAVAAKRVMTNFPILPDDYAGMGAERYQILRGGESITNAWYTRAYRRETNPPWASDLEEVIAHTNAIFDTWAAHDKEYFRGQLNGGKPWWQTCHTSIYDITNRTLRVAVQETDDWYVFAVDQANVDLGPIEAQIASLSSSVSGLDSSKRDKTDFDIRAVTQVYELIDEGTECSDSAFHAEAWKTIWKEEDDYGVYYHIGSFPDIYLPGETWSEMYSGWRSGDYVWFDMLRTGSGIGATIKFLITSKEEIVDHLAKESQLADKRDKTDLNVYGTRPVFSEWVLHDLSEGRWPLPEGAKVVWMNHDGVEQWVIADASGEFAGIFHPVMSRPTDPLATSLYTEMTVGNYFADADREQTGVEPAPTSDRLAKESQLADKRDKTDNRAYNSQGGVSGFYAVKRTAFSGNDVVKVDGSGFIEKAIAGIDYLKPGDLRLHSSTNEAEDVATPILDALFDDANTNQTARSSTAGKVMALIEGPVEQKVNNAVSANLNTYVDGETGVEYVGKFYGGSLYYFPTGTVYPPNN